ncbi:hypothetical protein [Thiohalocapsa sp. ML1]|uniref:hypothetical protein n=1 Tax=Thiohalocapsa sp. ML1 TaxID=1431688 RepID=UPI000A708380|nr:hypothetical protein [Thiohalocapsa sp. ML1]
MRQVSRGKFGLGDEAVEGGIQVFDGADAADWDRRLSSRLGADAADWDRRLSSRLGADAADWDRRLSSRLGADAAQCRVGGV